MHLYLKIVLLSFATVLFQHCVRLFYIAQSYGNTRLKHYPGDCHLVKGFTTDGSEDMTLLPSGRVLITSGMFSLRSDFDPAKSLARGHVYMMDTNQGYDSVQKVEIKGWPSDAHFEPHGIHHWVHDNKSVSVFIILHMPETVARFLYDGDRILTLTKVYQNATYFRTINSVFVTGEDSFYVTNIFNARFEDKLMPVIEYLLYVPWASLTYASGDSYTTAVDGMLLANGLTGDDRHLYMATKDAVKIFSRNTDNSLLLYKSIPVAIGSLDNLKLDHRGDLWVGCQPHAVEVLSYLSDSRNSKCHSTIIRIRDPTGVADIESVFEDDTSLIQGSSVAIYTNRKLLIGSIGDKMAVCDVNYLAGK